VQRTFPCPDSLYCIKTCGYQKPELTATIEIPQAFFEGTPMKYPARSIALWPSLMLASGVLFGVAGYSQSLGQPDPARWAQEDTSPEARFQTAKKEAGAALQEALAECRKLAPAEQTDCMAQARGLYQTELGAAKEQKEPPPK
jgi:hypothetical protein